MEKMKTQSINSVADDTSSVKELQARINATIKSLSPIAKKEMKGKLEAAGLPTVIGQVTDVDILNQIFEIVSA